MSYTSVAPILGLLQITARPRGFVGVLTDPLALLFLGASVASLVVIWRVMRDRR